MTDFTQPGSDGELPADFKEWQRGVTYTVRPDILSPLIPGKQYRIVVSVRRKVPKNEDFTAYGDLYQRATAIAAVRAAEIKGAPLHTWILGHAWSYREFGEHKFIFVVVTVGVLCPRDGDEKPAGVDPPAREALTTPGQEPPEIFAALGAAPKSIDETYTDFDHGDPRSANSNIVLFSYGEYVPSAEGLNFEPYIERAERLARSHRNLIAPGPLEIIRREWLCATHPDIAVVHIYFRI